MKTDIATTMLKSQYKECVLLQLKHAFPQARVLSTGILPRKKIPSEIPRGCNECLCNLCAEENVGFAPLLSDLQKAGKTLLAKYSDGDSVVMVNERGVAQFQGDQADDKQHQ